MRFPPESFPRSDAGMDHHGLRHSRRSPIAAQRFPIGVRNDGYLVTSRATNIGLDRVTARSHSSPSGRATGAVDRNEGLHSVWRILLNRSHRRTKGYSKSAVTLRDFYATQRVAAVWVMPSDSVM